MARPPMVAVIGKKHSGKTTLTVRLCAELHRRGHRVMTIKHGSHTFNIDPSTTDTYRHYHEGSAERVAMAAPDKFALIVRWSEEIGPEEIAARHVLPLAAFAGPKRHVGNSLAFSVFHVISSVTECGA